MLVDKTGGPNERAAFTLLPTTCETRQRGRASTRREARRHDQPRVLIQTPSRLHFGLLAWGQTRADSSVASGSWSIPHILS